MNQKKKVNQNNTNLSADDIQLYRLFCIFGAAILGFAAFRLITPATFNKLLYPVGQWVALALLVVAIGVFVYLRFVKKINELGHIVTVTGIAYFVIPVLFLLAVYLKLDYPEYKCQVLFGFISLFAAIYNIFKREFRVVSAVTFLSMAALYYASTSVYNSALEIVFHYISLGTMFLIPAAMLILLLLPKHPKKLLELVPDKAGTWITAAVCGALLVAALIVLLVPAIFLYVMISMLVIYVVIGIVCTIRLI